MENIIELGTCFVQATMDPKLDLRKPPRKSHRDFLEKTQ